MEEFALWESIAPHQSLVSLTVTDQFSFDSRLFVNPVPACTCFGTLKTLDLDIAMENPAFEYLTNLEHLSLRRLCLVDPKNFQVQVLGFLLFLIFINDLPKKCSPEDETQVMILADDTKTYQEIHRDEDQQLTDQKALQDRINNIAEWADEWKMEINPSKSKVVHIGKENPGLPYVINGTEISSVEVEKDIGFWISNDLSTSTHVQKARNKALGEISRIKRNFSYIDKRAFCILYNQRVRPHLDYGMAACPPNSSADSKLLEGVQAKATAMVYGLRNENADERRKKLGLMSLEQRRERGDLIEVFKILKGLTRIDPTKFWEVREARNGARLVKELATNGRKLRQSFFSYRVIQKWNLLPVELKTAPSLACFKARLDEKILKQT